MFTPLIDETLALLRVRLYRILLIWVPLGIGLLFGWTFSWERVPADIPIAVWNRDQQSLSRSFLRHVDSLPAMHISRLVSDDQEGKGLVCSGKVRGFLEIPPDFSQNLRLGRPARVIFHQDFNMLLPGRTLAKSMARMELWLQEEGLRTFFKKHGLSAAPLEFLANPLKIEYRKLFNPSLDYTQFLLPGLLCGLLFQILFLMGGKLFVSWHQPEERNPRGLWRRLFAALIASTIPFIIIFSFLFPLFSLGTGSLPQLLALYFLFAIASLLMGMTLAALFRREVMTIELIVGLGAVAFTLSGFTWPREMFPAVLRQLVGLYPLTWFLTESSKIWYHTQQALRIWPALAQILLYAGPLFFLVHHREVNRVQKI